MPKISVVLPVYNGDKYLKSSIESVLKQTYIDFELIIIDDCSTDLSAKIAHQYSDADERVKYYRNEQNLKLPLSLNRGFSLACGDYFTWTSCDNLYLPNAFEKMLEALEKDERIGLVYSSMQIIDEMNTELNVVDAGPPNHIIYRNVIGAAFMYRRQIAEQIGGYDPNLFLCEDYEYWLRIATTTLIVPIDSCLYQYRQHSESLSHQHEEKIIAKGIQVQKKYYSNFINTKKQAALFYAHLRARDIYNPFRHFYLLMVLFYSPKCFFNEVYGLIERRF